MKIKEIDLGWNAIVSELKKINGKSIEVGVFEDAGEYTKGKDPISVASVANIQEFGATLKRKEKVIGSIPERPFLRPSLEGLKLEQLMDLQKKLIGQLESKTPLRYVKVLSDIGKFQRDVIKKLIIDKKDPPNAKRTIDKKGFDDPLIETYKLHKSIKWKRKK